jgi:hypothetical protein
MAGGGLYILVAYGSQNVILNGNPDFTYFYTILKKHSHFAFESLTTPLEGPQELFFDQPIKLRATIKRVGDLLMDMYFTFTLPDIYSKYVNPQTRTSQYEFQWVRYVGAQIIQDASFFVGGTLVQQFDSDYIIASALTDQDETQYNKWQSLVGDMPEIYDPANGKYSGIPSGSSSIRTTGYYPSVINDTTNTGTQNNFPSIPGRTITVPLSFWFTKNTSLSLPFIALQYHECSVQLTLRPIQDLYTTLDPNGNRVRPGYQVDPSNTSLQQDLGNVLYSTATNASDTYIRNFLTDFSYATPELNTWPLNPRIQTTQVFLTDDERLTFSTKALTYLVRQVSQYNFADITSRKLFELFTHNPVTRLIILPRRSDSMEYRNAWTNYTNWWQYPAAPFIPTNVPVFLGGSSGQNAVGIQQDIIRQIRILCDGNEIQEIRPLQHFNEVASWKHATGVFPPGLAIYPFSLDTSEWIKPSGTLNTSRVRKFQIDIDLWPLMQDSQFTMNYQIYVESLNFFVVESGMGGMKYAT